MERQVADRENIYPTSILDKVNEQPNRIMANGMSTEFPGKET